MAPPSVSLEGRYRVHRPLVPIHALPVASSKLLRYLHPSEKRRRPQRTAPPKVGSIGALATQITAVRTAARGSRNNTLNRSAFIAGIWVAAGDLEEDAARAELLTAALSAGLPEREALATITSGLTAGKRKGTTYAGRS